MEDIKKMLERRRKEIAVKKSKIPSNMRRRERGGRTWKQVAQDFCRNMHKLFKLEGTDHWVYAGKVMRDLVGDPDNGNFRRHCLEYGITIKKDSISKSYNVMLDDTSKRKMKKYGRKN